jgi:hypothetical protein
MRCPHVGAVPEHELMADEDIKRFLNGELPTPTLADRVRDRFHVLVCSSCFAKFKKASQEAKFFDWDGLVSVVRTTKPKATPEQPLDRLFASGWLEPNPANKSSPNPPAPHNPGAICGEAAPN